MANYVVLNLQKPLPLLLVEKQGDVVALLVLALQQVVPVCRLIWETFEPQRLFVLPVLIALLVDVRVSWEGLD